MRECLGADSLIEGVGLPSQRNSPSLDPTLWVVVPRGAKLNVLRRLVIRKEPLYAIVEFLSKCFQVLGSVEF